MQKFIFFFPILFFLKIIKSQLIISISPYQSKLKKLFNHYFDFFQNNFIELEDIEVNNQSIQFDNMILKKKENLNPYLKCINESYNFIVFAPFPFKLEGNFSFYKNSIKKRGKIIISIYYIYAKQIIKDNKYDFDIIIKEKKSDVESNYRLFLDKADPSSRMEILKLLDNQFLKNNIEVLKGLIRTFLFQSMEDEYKKSVHLILSSIFKKKDLRIDLSFVKFPEFYKNISILTYYSGNIKGTGIMNNTFFDNEEFKNFSNEQQNKKKYFINYELLKQIISKSEYGKNNIILSKDFPLQLPEYFFDIINWESIINNQTDSNTVKIIINIKNIRNNQLNTILNTKLNIKIMNESNEVIFLEFNSKVDFYLKVNLKYSSTINICTELFVIKEIDDKEKSELIEEKLYEIFDKNIEKICLFEKGINLSEEFIYIDEYYLEESGIYIIGEGRKEY
jgi:hypothetical protein